MPFLHLASRACTRTSRVAFPRQHRQNLLAAFMGLYTTFLVRSSMFIGLTFCVLFRFVAVFAVFILVRSIVLTKGETIPSFVINPSNWHGN